MTPGSVSELVRAQMERLGLPYSLDVAEAYAEELEILAPPARVAFAAAASERLLRHLEAQPAEEREADPEDWRDLQDAIWEALAGAEDAALAVRTSVVEIGEDYTEEHDVDAVAAVLYTGQALAYEDAEAVILAAERALDAATLRADEDLSTVIRPQRLGSVAPPDLHPETRLAAHPEVQGEIRMQRADLDLLLREGITSEVLARLRGEPRT